jgi:predicted metal-dependent enzyme (double-stranded beta helix superfamily)
VPKAARSGLNRREHGGMLDLDLDTFVADCLVANKEAQPRLAVKEVLARAVSNPSAVAAALPPARAEIERIHVSDELTIIKVVWAPGMRIRPHDHRTWACIGTYSGGEDNAFYRRAERGLTDSGGLSLQPGEVCLLGDDTIHAVHNPTAEFAGAIHIYGGNFFEIERSEWADPHSLEEPYDVEATLRLFEEANAPFDT